MSAQPSWPSNWTWHCAGAEQDPGHLPGLEESLQRRTMYPAGRILHLVPAFLVFTEEELQKLGEPLSLYIQCVLQDDENLLFGYLWHLDHQCGCLQNIAGRGGARLSNLSAVSL